MATGDRFEQRNGYLGKPLLYYPEEVHVPDEQACETVNARIMKHIMKQKMGKNETFYSSKVLGTGNDQHFLKVLRSNQLTQSA